MGWTASNIMEKGSENIAKLESGKVKGKYYSISDIDCIGNAVFGGCFFGKCKSKSSGI